MAQKTQDFNVVDFQNRFFAPFARLNELAVRNFEQAARFGYEVAGDVLELTIAQARAAADARDVAALVSRQSELATSFIDKQSQRTNDWLKIATRAQTDFTGWAGKTADAATDELKAASRQAA
ncbi:MAG: phasin family protein [Steroidobacteraceae bacterium]